MTKPHISILGHFDPEVPAHAATREAIIHAENELGTVLDTRWVELEELAEPEAVLAGTCGAIIAPDVPRGPRRLHHELLTGLTWLRENRIPTLAIERGYHHLLIEAARNLLGQPEANSRGFDEATEYPIVTRLHGLSATIEGTRPELLEVEIAPETVLAGAYGQAGDIREPFRGHYVLNPDYAPDLERAGFELAARGRRGDTSFVAAVAWKGHPFWVGVGWMPQFASNAGRPHPVISALIRAALNDLPSN